MVGYLVPADDLTDPDRDLPRIGHAPGTDSGNDLGQLRVGGLQ